jgi:hypothetical protein
MTPRWLLEVTVEGRIYRWSEVALQVETEAGDVLEFAGGLADLTLAEGDEAAVSISDPAINWPQLGALLQTAPCSVRRWLSGTVYERAVVYSLGEAVDVSWGARVDSASWTVGRPRGSQLLGVELPAALSRVDETTWPKTVGHVIGNEGGYYPILLGYPGWLGGSLIYPTVPAPIAEWQASTPSTTIAVVSEDPAAPVTQVFVRNDNRGTEALEDIQLATDLLGQALLVVDFDLDDATMPSDPGSSLFFGCSPAGGGGVARSAYDVVVYLLRRFGPDSVDWDRLPEIRDVLGPYQVDSWLDQPLTDPWAWIEGTLVEDLPIAVRTSRRGRYFVERRWVSDPRLQVGAINVDRGEAARQGSLARDGDPVNEFVAYYRNSRDGLWLSRLVHSGELDLLGIGATTIQQFTTTQLVTYASSARARASTTRFGRRQTTPVEIDWTWDTGTVAAVLEQRAQRESLPAILVEYEIEDGETLQESDELLLTDSELGWVDRPAIVDAPPVRGTKTSVVLRVPE